MLQLIGRFFTAWAFYAAILNQMLLLTIVYLMIRADKQRRRAKGPTTHDSASNTAS